MLLPKFDYHEPATLGEACQVMGDLGLKAKALAGGTDLIVNMKKKILSPACLVSLGRIKELKKIDSSNGLLKIGAGLTAAEVAETEEIKNNYSALSRGASCLGSPLIRNLATIAGNLVSARPAADFPPPLMAYGARVVLKSSSGERVVSLDDFFKGPGRTLIAPEEILIEIVLDKLPPFSGAGYIKLGTRQTLEISLVNVAAFVSLDGPGGVIKTARIVLGAVGPVPLRAPSAEKALIGEKPSEALLAKAGEAAALDSKPIDDYRGSAEYRRAMVDVLTRRALIEAVTAAGSNLN
ncbi:MAG: xanthine dehydrogenase family protein subunit M [Deltaproteobacteria bacterium]|nr:xanthine dehydrogenase family protein subunit M [Deltaproteobacteria bacterium]